MIEPIIHKLCPRGFFFFGELPAYTYTVENYCDRKNVDEHACRFLEGAGEQKLRLELRDCEINLASA
jgi:hypothetical protein